MRQLVLEYSHGSIQQRHPQSRQATTSVSKYNQPKKKKKKRSNPTRETCDQIRGNKDHNTGKATQAKQKNSQTLSEKRS